MLSSRDCCVGGTRSCCRRWPGGKTLRPWLTLGFRVVGLPLGFPPTPPSGIALLGGTIWQSFPSCPRVFFLMLKPSSGDSHLAFLALVKVVWCPDWCLLGGEDDCRDTSFSHHLVTSLINISVLNILYKNLQDYEDTHEKLSSFLQRGFIEPIIVDLAISVPDHLHWSEYCNKLSDMNMLLLSVLKVALHIL